MHYEVLVTLSGAMAIALQALESRKERDEKGFQAAAAATQGKAQSKAKSKSKVSAKAVMKKPCKHEDEESTITQDYPEAGEADELVLDDDEEDEEEEDEEDDEGDK